MLAAEGGYRQEDKSAAIHRKRVKQILTSADEQLTSYTISIVPSYGSQSELYPEIPTAQP